MEYFEYLKQLTDQYMPELVLAAAVMALLSLILVCINWLRTGKILRKYKRLMRGVDNKNLEALLYEHLANLQQGLTRLKDAELSLTELKSKLGCCIQRVGIIRYNAFEQMGGDQSYSIALMNDHGTGFVITGLYGRNASTTFAKPLHNKQSKYPLSVEETQAIERAFMNKPVND